MVNLKKNQEKLLDHPKRCRKIIGENSIHTHKEYLQQARNRETILSIY